ncbi:MAG: hypothetical protein JXA78_17260 [Anaerolineales bacterium]|nr:hypothetical protein [Anaerolineales bacterium]
MSGHYYVDFLADTRRRDEEISYANEHRAAKDLPARPAAVVRLYQRGMFDLGALLVSLGYRMQRRYERMRMVKNAAAISKSTPDPC